MCVTSWYLFGFILSQQIASVTQLTDCIGGVFPPIKCALQRISVFWTYWRGIFFQEKSTCDPCGVAINSRGGLSPINPQEQYYTQGKEINKYTGSIKLYCVHVYNNFPKLTTEICLFSMLLLYIVPVYTTNFATFYYVCDSTVKSRI